MIVFDKELVPARYDIYKAGAYSVFSLPQFHKTEKGSKHRDGFINVLIKGYLPWQKGDGIIVRREDLTGINRIESNGLVNVTVYAETVELVTKQKRKEAPNKTILAEDIPEDI